ncbi:MAG: carboxypeptidase regulatory-like domain-containing protein [Planctomycetes bacterium]|nr:carboxypeptidase regulatory-like domain-containing protein [Planctomycetota bacterium]
MALRLHERSFLLISVAALLLAGGFGFVLGLTGGGVTVIPAAQGEPEPASDPSSASNRPRANRETAASNRAGPTHTNKTNREPEKPDKPDINPVTSGGPRKLPAGRVDPVVESPQIAEAVAEIEVTLKDSQGRQMPFAQVALDIVAGPLGWQTLSSSPEQSRGQRGVFVFKSLYPGSYRVRSTAANYAPAEQEVTIHAGSSTEQVALVLTPLGNCAVEFYPRLSSGETPQDVLVQIDAKAANDDDKGRFGSHRQTATTDPRGLISPTSTRIRVGQDGAVKMILNIGVPVSLTFSAAHEGKSWVGNSNITPEGIGMKVDVTLNQSSDTDNPLLAGAGGTVSLTVILTVDGSAEREFTRVNLRARPDDFAYRQPTSSSGNRFLWDNLAAGRWYIVAEARDVHAPFVTQIEVTESGEQQLDIRTGHLRVNAQREPGSPDPEGDALYRVRLRPMGSGTLERTFNGNLKGKQSDYIDFFVPAGDFDVHVDSPEQSAPLVAEPTSRPLKMTAGGNVTLEYVLRAAVTLTFRCVNGAGVPVPNAEFLVTFHAAGAVPDSEKANVRKGGSDGMCKLPSAPYGAVYVMIWTTSDDWNNPDRVFQLDLPAFGIKDLGNVVVAP